MKLELGKIFIKDVRFGDASKIDGGVLTVSKSDLEKVVLEDDKLKAVSFDVAHPGESVRITPVKDVIEPRVKVEGSGGIFPGVIAKVDTVGSGKTYALKGMAVVTAGKIVGFQEGVMQITEVMAAQTAWQQAHTQKIDAEIEVKLSQVDLLKALGRLQ